ncbi:MAG TPA: NAD(P)/FAD-dependent oxidoreductase [Candidatus Baltobacteraceae bacterium]|jgi:protoporphyrinogen oxidase|nr:NAD(P)/FAD-dependent oxidoreductase [Candidatus Baltobacteraceae bacterium]
MKRRWGVVGGGMLGLTLAHRIRQSGDDVTVLEESADCGGLASPWKLGDVTWDRHYHVTLYSDLALRSLLSELQLESRMDWVTTRTGFFTDGRLYSFSDVMDFVRFPPLNPLQKARLAATILHASRITDWHSLERITALEWLRRYSGAQTVEKIWHPLLRAKLGANAEKASAAFIWAIIARMYAARRTGMKRELFGYVPGGYSTILARYVEVLRESGVEIVTGSRVQSVTPASGDRVRVLASDGSEREFDRVAVTLAAPLAARLCGSLTEAERNTLTGVEYQGIICASLLLDAPLSNYYVTNITDTWVPFTAVIEMTALVKPEMLGGQALVYLPKYVVPDDPGFDLSDEELRDQFLAALQRMYPDFPQRSVRAFRVSRVRHVLPISTLGYSDRLPSIRTSVPNLFTVNSAHIVNGTLNVNETVELANRTARELLAS